MKRARNSKSLFLSILAGFALHLKNFVQGSDYEDTESLKKPGFKSK